MSSLLASDYDKSKYFRTEDQKQEKKLRNKEVTEAVFERDGDKPEKKPVLWFTNDERGLVLNKTNLRILRDAFGDRFADWIGKIIVVYPTMEPFRGKMVPCLRVRIPPPKQATVAPQQPVTSGNGANAPAPTGNGAAAALPAAPPVAAAAPPAAAALAAADPELEPDPVKPLREDLDDEIPF